MPFDKYTLGCYLLDRLEEVGVQDMFGVPGDFNLRFLDDVMTHRIKWIGTANELNAAYAADGYARCRGIGCLLTTYGVGELSAANGVAGSYAESVPVIHIAGAPSYAIQNNRALVHHSLGDGDFLHYVRISNEFCCAAVMLTPEKAREQIDHVITEVLYHKKPGYIALPTDLAETPCQPPAAPLIPRLPLFSECSLDAFEAAAAEIINKAKNGCVLVGHLVERYNLVDQLNHFLTTIDIPFVMASIGKGAANEQLKNYIGVYIPGDRPSAAAAVVEKSDFTITYGVELTDLVTFGFKHHFSTNTIHVHPFEVTIGEQRFMQIPMHKAIAVLQELCHAAQKNWKNTYITPETFQNPDTSKYDLTNMWNEIQKSLRPGDIVLGDMGTSALSSVLLRLPEGATYVVQNLYGSIGFTMPAALGCQAAFPERRVICIIGDGAAQMTVQDIGTVARENLNVQYVLVNNDGYTIERYIRGMHAHYNDISSWDWLNLAKSLCRSNEPITNRVEKAGELEKLLKDSPKKMQFIEVIVGMLEAPLRCPMPLPLVTEELYQ